MQARVRRAGRKKGGRAVALGGRARRLQALTYTDPFGLYPWGWWWKAFKTVTTAILFGTHPGGDHHDHVDLPRQRQNQEQTTTERKPPAGASPPPPPTEDDGPSKMSRTEGLRALPLVVGAGIVNLGLETLRALGSLVPNAVPDVKPVVLPPPGTPGPVPVAPLP